jgi:hypothetical protein
MTAPFRSERCPCGRRWEHCPRRNELEFAPARPAGAGRRAVMREHSLKQPRPALGRLCAILAALAATPAGAAQCPYGQIYRVHLDECVSARSALATAYVRPVARLPRFRPARRLADADAPPPDPLPPPAPAPTPEPHQATLVLPDIEDGAPAIWRLCHAAPNLCGPTTGGR